MARVWAILAGAALLLAPLAAASAQDADPELTELRARAEAGDAGAQNDLGGRLWATEDQALVAEARDWFRRAMAGGDAEAMNNYAVMLMMGEGGPADEAEGRRLRDEAAARGSVGANLSLAERYLAGAEGYPRDPRRAFEHVRAASETPGAADHYALWRLAMMHLQGIGTPVDVAEAWRLVVRASDGGSVSAMVSRAVMLATGEGVAEDDAAARLWYQRAAESGDVQFHHGLRGLGAMLLAGEGGPVDVPRGIAYLMIAAAADNQEASALLEPWRERATAEQGREAIRISDQWMAEHFRRD